MATVGDLEIANDAILYMVLKKDGSDAWEVRVAQPGTSERSMCLTRALVGSRRKLTSRLRTRPHPRRTKAKPSHDAASAATP